MNSQVYISKNIDNVQLLTDNYKLFNCTISFISKTDNKIFVPTYNVENDFQDIAVQLTVQNQELGLDFTTSVITNNLKYLSISTVLFAGVTTAMAYIQCVACYVAGKQLHERVLSPTEVSTGTLRFLNVFDFYIWIFTLKHLESYMLIAFTVIPYIILTLGFELRLILLIGAARKRLSSQKTIKLNFANRIWLIISLICLIMSCCFGYPGWIYMSFTISLVPQIVQNLLLRQRHRWNILIFVPLSLTKLPFVIYFTAYDMIKLLTIPKLPMFYAIVFIYAAQILILCLQRRKSSLYDLNPFYKFFKITETQLITQESCCICLEKMSSSQQEANEDAEFITANHDDRKNNLVTTECNHQFHEACLRGWLDLKSECPYCRAVLPVMLNDD